MPRLSVTRAIRFNSADGEVALEITAAADDGDTVADLLFAIDQAEQELDGACPKCGVPNGTKHREGCSLRWPRYDPGENFTRCPECGRGVAGAFTLGTHLVVDHGRNDAWIREKVPGLLADPETGP